MTKHSIEELKRQEAAARGRLENAKADAREAKQRLTDAEGAALLAELAQRGIDVCKTRVRVRNQRHDGTLLPGYDGKGSEFFVTGYELGAYPSEARLTFAKVKKDGTASAAGHSLWGHIALDRLEIVGAGQ